jgi:hypothetical protein
LSCPPDSIIELSNMGSLFTFEEELLFLDTALFCFVPAL